MVCVIPALISSKTWATSLGEFGDSRVNNDLLEKHVNIYKDMHEKSHTQTFKWE